MADSSQLATAPVSPQIIKLLCDKVHDKRKLAAAEIGKIVTALKTSDQYDEIQVLIEVFIKQLALSHVSNSRKGGLLGLATVAVSLGEHAQFYKEQLISPIMACLNDNDDGVRYHACEALFNLLKVLRKNSLVFFNEIFDVTSKLTSDPDMMVKACGELVDRLLKDIVLENEEFLKSDSCIMLIRERMYSKEQSAKHFVIGWISFFESLPGHSLIPYLYEILDGLLFILNDKPNIVLTTNCTMLLDQYLVKLSKCEDLELLDKLIRILLVYSQSTSSDQAPAQSIAFQWILHFLTIDCFNVLKYFASILSAVLICIDSSKIEDKNHLNICKSIDIHLKKHFKSATKSKLLENVKLLEDAVKMLLTFLIQDASANSKLGSIEWINILQSSCPQLLEIDYIVKDITASLIKLINDQNEKVVKQSVDLICAMYHSMQEITGNLNWAEQTIFAVTEELNCNKICFETRAEHVLKQLCSGTDAKIVYLTIAKHYNGKDPSKICDTKLVKLLNFILLTCTETHELRVCIRDRQNEETIQLLNSLFYAWSFDPIAILSLCLLSRNYQQAYKIVNLFSKINLTVKIMVELDRLVKLLESPVFTCKLCLILINLI
ncbi:hypothetical protein GJ496_010629 [Pomphorhynchus laevis]|nr:hypothetical protein GJ496_010629 [Pomphorhynchus laevis]